MPTHANLPSEIARYIDHTLLKAEATESDIRRVCSEARTHGFATVCVNSGWVRRVAQELAGSATLPISVVGFPLGAMAPEAKAFETRLAIENGAREIDTVIALGLLKAGQIEAVLADLRAVVQAAGPIPVKVILETASLTREEKILGCQLSVKAGAAFVKTSTGFGSGGATVDDIRLMRETVGPKIGVKASGGIRTFDDARRMIEAGATRLGASASVQIIQEARNSGTESNPSRGSTPSPSSKGDTY
jgi:deoxyribose-phosphate aldolase